MRTAATTAIVAMLFAAPAIVPGTVFAQQSGTTTEPAMEHGQDQMAPKSTARSSSCFNAAMQFDSALTQKTMGTSVAQASQMYAAATQMRNEGMEKCHAGQTSAGRMQIEEATRALQS